MSPAAIGIAGFALIIILVLLGVNVAFAIVGVGFVGLVMVMGLETTLESLAIISFAQSSSYNLSVVPLFLLMSTFVSHSEIGKEAYETARAWLGQFRGGLAMATTAACGLFAACCGSSLASALAMGEVAYPEMKRHKYDAKLSVGAIAAGGTLGILIPPSMGFIIIGILTEVSIGKLFIAGIIPGILEIVFYIGTIAVICMVNPKLGPPSPKTTVRQKFGSLMLTWPVLLLFLLVIGGIYGGVFTPTEAGGIGAFGALVISLARRQLNRSSFASCFLETARTSAMIVALIIGAFIFNQFLAVTRLPFVASQYVVGLGLNKYAILVIILIIYIILGMVFDIYAVLILTIPTIFPTMMALGFHPIWYCVIMVRIVEIGMITPPFGLNLFALAGVVDAPVGTMYRGIIPFFIADILHVALLVMVPSISTFLPEMMIRAG